MNSVSSNAVANKITDTVNFCLKSWSNVLEVDLSDYFEKISYSHYCGVVLFGACFDIDNAGIYLISCSLLGGVYVVPLQGANNRSFNFDPNTKILTWTATGSQQASNHFVLLG